MLKATRSSYGEVDDKERTDVVKSVAIKIFKQEEDFDQEIQIRTIIDNEKTETSGNIRGNSHVVKKSIAMLDSHGANDRLNSPGHIPTGPCIINISIRIAERSNIRK